MNIFDRAEIYRPREQEQIFCPFCGVSYISPLEVRTLVDCIICNGRGGKARAAEQVVDAILRGLHDCRRDTIILDMVERYVRKLGPGYYRGEYRTFWRELKEELEEAQ